MGEVEWGGGSSAIIYYQLIQIMVIYLNLFNKWLKINYWCFRVQLKWTQFCVACITLYVNVWYINVSSCDIISTQFLFALVFRYYILEYYDIISIVTDWCIITYNLTIMLKIWIVLYLFHRKRRYWFTRCNKTKGG